jgi:hypothetical protein
MNNFSQAIHGWSQAPESRQNDLCKGIDELGEQKYPAPNNSTFSGFELRDFGTPGPENVKSIELNITNIDRKSI